MVRDNICVTTHNIDDVVCMVYMTTYNIDYAASKLYVMTLKITYAYSMLYAPINNADCTDILI